MVCRLQLHLLCLLLTCLLATVRLNIPNSRSTLRYCLRCRYTAAHTDHCDAVFAAPAAFRTADSRTTAAMPCYDLALRLYTCWFCYYHRTHTRATYDAALHRVLPPLCLPSNKATGYSPPRCRVTVAAALTTWHFVVHIPFWTAFRTHLAVKH